MRRWIAVFVVLFLSACGFQLRGSYGLPFDTLHIALPESHELHAALKRQIEASTKTRVVGNPKEAQAVLSVLLDNQAKDILSVSSAGRVREFQLVRTFRFQVLDGTGQKTYIPPTSLRLNRDMTFDDTRVLAKEYEEALLWRDIQADLVQQLMRRLAAAKLKQPEE